MPFTVTGIVANQLYDPSHYELPWDVKSKVVDWLREADEKYHEFGRAFNAEPVVIRERPSITARQFNYSELDNPNFFDASFKIAYVGEKTCAGYYLAQKIAGKKNIDTFHWKGILVNFGIPEGLIDTIVYYNDTYKLTFAEIAKLIDDRVKIKQEPKVRFTDISVV